MDLTQTYKKIVGLLLCLLPVLAWAQPMVWPLTYNPVLAAKQNIAFKHAKAQNDTLDLPFIEDFSGGQLGYPNPSLFSDSGVYVNTDFCIGQPTIGCATFDGLNKNGSPYSNQLVQDYADRLTSHPIHLDGLTPADSVYFSFLYQPQGRGDGVENNDRLELRFYDNTLAQWITVWQASAGPLDTFKLVMVPITNPGYFSANFKFQFTNFGAMYGMYDIWNIDYIYLNSGRFKTDTTFNDVAFVNKASSLLEFYQHMPYTQYPDPVTKIRFTETNLADSAKQTNFSFFGNYNQVPPTICNGNFPSSGLVQPVYTNGYNTSSQQVQPALDGCTYPTMTQEEEYTITYVFQAASGSDLIKSNDTISYTQVFSDYYAFDDGTAEASYEIQGANVEGAIRLALNKPDTLRAVHFYFVKNYNNIEGKEFSLKVWKASATDPNLPGDVIYEKAGLKPVWQDYLNQFYTYYIDDALLALPADENFFIGWYQKDSYDIKLGFDRNINHSDITFFKVGNGGTWQQSTYNGTLMIRPVVGDNIVNPMGVAEPTQTNSFANVYLYPNPASNVVTISNYANLGSNALSYTVYNMQGNVLSNGKTTAGQFDVALLQNGFYFVALANDKGQALTRKLIIAH